ncbi:hypothetical protein BGZ70_009564 [Mortierella alpina]|uniref:Uncharacterized protein n=1 Tax=Mortierella alpina TaxID=64518 RepID=A0A9P6J0W1_MORAP|nr:hypothetical protein BGZ70_009564 [Mortierella alpina]
MMASTSARTLWRKSYDDKDVQDAKEEPEVVKGSRDGSTIQQNSIVANPAVWWMSSLGLVVFAGLQVLFLLSGLFGYMNEGYQFSLLLVLILTITSVSNFISPLSYGTRMTRSQCESLAHWVNKGAALLQLPILPQQDPIATRPTVVLDCGTPLATAAASTSFPLTPLQVTPVVRRRRAPVLQKHYPAIEEPLPMQHIFMTPSQRPPQLWHVNRQAGEPNPYQRQQMQSIFELIEKEEKQKRVKERLEREEKERLERQERQRLELEEKRREMERALKREHEAKERERRRLEEKRRRQVEDEVDEELKREQEVREVAW